MKKIKTYNIRRNYKKYILLKLTIFSSIFLVLFSFINQFWLNGLTTDILQDWRISQTKLYNNIKNLTFNGTTWPVKQITDLSYQSIKDSWLTYWELRKLPWKEVPASLKTFFPTKISDYINKYQNITLQTCWNVFTNPEALNKFTFMRRIIRTTWTASYDSKLIWKKGSGTHAWVDIIWNVWTPIYAIANWIVVEIEHSNKWFWNHIDILHKINNKYYMSIYAHLHSINNKLKIWDLVAKWDLVWKMGHSWNAFGTHLHLQINKVFTLQDVLNWRVSLWWYHDLAWVRAYTVNPITFVEKYYKAVWDNFQTIKKEWILDKQIQQVKKIKVVKKTVAQTKKIEKKKELKNINIKKEDNLDLVKVISKDLKKEHSVAKVNPVAYIKNVSLSLIDNKVQLWHGFTIKLAVFTWNGNISIIPSNENLSFSPDIIQNPDRPVYNINVLATQVWNTKLRIYDGKSVREYDVNIYNNVSNQIFWIKVVSSWLNLLSENKLTIYPVNKFWQILHQKLSWLFKIYVEQNWEKYLLKTLQINSDEWETYIKWYFLGKWKLIVSSDKYYSKQNIITNIAKDYKYNGKYANDIYSLIKSNIIHWENWKLFPNRKITRRELLTILWRSILKVNYKKAKIEMLNYLKTKWKFFKDIDGKSYSDPYIYIAWKKWIVKWQNWRSLANNNVSKAELLTIYTRLFKLKITLNKLNVWTDLRWNTKLKAIADTCKKYELYPFQNYNIFNAGKFVSRLIAFETLKRFIDISSVSNTHLSASVPQKTETKENLEKTMSDIFNF